VQHHYQSLDLSDYPMPRILFGWPAFFLLAFALQAWNIAVGLGDAPRERLLDHAAFEPGGYLFGDSAFYAAIADSLLRDGDLDLLNQCFPGKSSLADALPELQGERGGEFGLTADGRLTIKQSPVLSAAALPFYALFGRPGLLLFNLITLNLLLAGMVKLAGDTPAARVVVLLGFAATPLWRYSFNFSPDLFLCALLVGALLAAQSNRPVLSGILAGLAVSTKIYIAALVLPVPLVVWTATDKCRWMALVRFGVGGIIGLAPGLVFNAWLFGAPWATGYEHQLLVRGEQVALADHSSRFTVPPLTGLRNLLFDAEVGLWPTATVWFLWPVAALLLVARRRERVWTLAVVGVIVMNLAVFACYDGWNGSAIGNRYLFPALICGIALIGAAASRIGRCGKSRPAGATRSRDSAEDVEGARRAGLSVSAQ
jgi:hypothetical protein